MAASTEGRRCPVMHVRRNLVGGPGPGVTLRTRSTPLVRHIQAIDPKAWKTINLDRDGYYRKPQIVDEDVTLSTYAGTIRQLIVWGLGRDAPTVLITNDRRSSHRPLVGRTRCVRIGLWRRVAIVTASTDEAG